MQKRKILINSLNIRRKIGAWAAHRQKTTLLILAILAFYSYFHFGLEDGSWVLTAFRIVAIALLLLLLLSPLKPKDTYQAESKESPQPEIITKSENEKYVDIIRELSEEYYLKTKRDTAKDYKLFLTRILSIVKRTFAAHSAVIFLLDPDTRTLRQRCIVSNEEHVKENMQYVQDELIFKKIFESNSPFLSNEPDEVKSLLPYYPESVSASSLLAAPVYINDDIGGILIVDSLEHNAFSGDDVHYIETYGGIIAETIVNYNNLLEFENSTQLFSFFYEVSRGLNTNLKFEEILDLLLSVMQNVIHYDRLTISAYETGSDQAKIIRIVGQVDDFPEGTTFPLNEGLNGWIIRKRKPLLIPDLEKDDHFIPRYTTKEKMNYNLRSFLGAPISYHDVCFGAVTVESQKPDSYQVHHKKLLVMLANNFGVALERSHALQELEQHATTDGLTKLHNYRMFMQRIYEEIERADRYNLNFTLLMMDIDHFKRVNDQYGHLAGDKILTQIAASIKKNTRNVDFSCRYGGEEFAVILVETGLQEALLTAERIRKNIENLNTNYKGDIIHVTVSIGAVEFPNSSKDVESLINEADKALYRAKSEGRNRVVPYKEKSETVI